MVDKAGREPIHLDGPTVYLRHLSPDDVTDAYVGWMSDGDVTRYLEARHTLHSSESLRRWVGAFDQVVDQVFGIFLQSDDRHVGTATLRCRSVHETAEYGYLIGDRSLWGTPVAVEAMVLLFDHAFEVMGLRKLHGGAYRTNLASLFNYQRFGFTREGVLRRHSLLDGEPTDMLVFGLLREEWVERRRAFDARMGVS
jgi:RimJ/RimL family protein N-acetyltransferase